MSVQEFLSDYQALKNQFGKEVSLQELRPVKVQQSAENIVGVKALWARLDTLLPKEGWLLGTSQCVRSISAGAQSGWWEALRGQPLLQGEWCSTDASADPDHVIAYSLRHLGGFQWVLSCCQMTPATPEQATHLASRYRAMLADGTNSWAQHVRLRKYWPETGELAVAASCFTGFIQNKKSSDEGSLS